MGFKGAWLCYLLSQAGSAHVTGFGRDERTPLLYAAACEIGDHTGIN